MYTGFDITNKVIVVTGGVSGIGRAIAHACAHAGAKVIAADVTLTGPTPGSVNAEKTAAVMKELDAIGPGHGTVPINVTDEASVKDAFDAVANKWGRVDGVLNAAGIIKRQASFDVPAADFRRIIDVNLTGTFIVNQAAGRVMRNQTPDAHGERGSIINIASLGSFVSLTEVLAYTASKSGVLGVTRGLANEWAQYGIRVNAIAPGVFPTDLNRKLIEGTPRGDFMIAHTPQGRFGKAEELCGAAIYLFSPSASFTTGQTLVVDGGFLCRGVGV